MKEITIVLVEPLYGGNIGSVARAMANFELSNLALVNPAPRVFEDKLLEPMARGAMNLIHQAKIYESLGEALKDVEIAIGFTKRSGRRRRGAVELNAAMDNIRSEFNHARVAAVFGREDAGLTTAELGMCHWPVSIPTNPNLPSLNLAQAVCLFAYEAYRRASDVAPPEPETRRPAPVGDLEHLYGHFETVLRRIEFFEEASPDRMMNEVRRIFSRRVPDARDVRILRGILSKMEKTIDKLSENEKTENNGRLE